MADRTNYYFRQKVTEAELNLGFELLENADRNLATDIGIFGVISGAVPTPHSPLANLSIDLTGPARAYDALGERIFFGALQNVNCAVDSNNLPTDVPQNGQERWVSVFLSFTRNDWDPRTDGNSQQVTFREDESFQITVRQGPPGAIGTAPRVALVDDELLLCDVHLVAGQTQILAADIDITRRQSFVFATGNAISIIAGLWKVIVPVAGTVQAALDAIDAWLAAHIGGAAGHRHTATDVDYPPHGFLASSTVGAAMNELVDDLSSVATANPGASRVGAAAVAGSPLALGAGNVGLQIAAILATLNAHLSATQGAHKASAISVTPFSFLLSTSVQAILQELVNALLSQGTSGPTGASHIGAGAIAGQPNALNASDVGTQLAAILAFLNNHIKNPTGAHAASAISVATPGGGLNATDVNAALLEIVGAFAMDHFRSVDANPGEHRTIHQPALGASSAHVVLWDANPVGIPGSHLEVGADNLSIYFTLNAHWNGSAWQRYDTGYFSGGFRFSRMDFAILQDYTGAQTFTTWSSTWTLPAYNGTSPNAAFQTTGVIHDIGRVTISETNTSTASHVLSISAAANFRVRFPATPSSITLSTDIQNDVTPSAVVIFMASQDGFTATSSPTVPAGGNAWWIGTYNATA